MTSETFNTYIADLDFPNDLAVKAWENLASGRTLFLVMSGKMASGKDTIAPLVLERLDRSNAYHLYFADALKGEADEIFNIVRQSPSRDLATSRVASELEMSGLHAASLVDAVYDELHADPSLHARSRTKSIRFVLQILGTEVRRSQDPDYWVKIALRRALEELSAGRDVFVTDARFPNEIDACDLVGAFSVRLNITPSTQAMRLLARDGLLPSEDSLTHASETSLDSYQGYSLVIDNDWSIEECVQQVVDALSKKI